MGGGLLIDCVIDVCLCPLPHHPLHLSIGGGKPLLENPSSTVRKHSSHRVNPNNSERPLTSRCEWFSFRSVNANDSYSRLTRALGVNVSVSKRFLYLGFQSMLING